MSNILKGFNSFGDATITTHIRENLISFFDYGIVSKSGFINVEIPSTGYYNGDDHKLRPVNDPRYDNGQVWEGFRSNWVWESGLGALTSNDNTYPGVSGVYIDSIFHPTSTSGEYSHYINHTLGRVIFDRPISINSQVECNFSYKYVNTSRVDGLNWFKQIHQNSERSDNENFISNSGEWGILADNRIQLPAIGIELANTRKMIGYQLGGGQTVFTDFLFHCVAEDIYTRDHMIDIVSLQNDKVIKAYDLNKIAQNNAFPLDYRGVPVSGALLYPELVSLYEGNSIRLRDNSIDSVYSLTPNIHIGTIKFKAEVIVFGV